MSAQQIYDNFANAVGPGGLMQAADYVTSFQAQYESRAADIRTLAAAMEEGWTGDAAGAASRGAGPLAAEHAQAAESMSMAQAGLTTQSSAWHDVKAKVQPVPPVPQAPPPMTEFLGVQSVIDADIENQTRQSNNVAAANVAAMKSWSTASDETGRAMPTSYGQADANAMNVSSAPPPAPVVHSSAGHNGGSAGPLQPGHSPGPAASYDGANVAPFAAGAAASGRPSAPGSGVPPRAAGSGGDESTSSAGYVAPSAQTGLEQGGTSRDPGLYRSGVLDPAPPLGAGNGGSWNSGAPAVGGGLPGGASGRGSSGSGAGLGGRAAGENAPGSGRGSGIGASEEAAARSRTGGAAGSSSGRPGGAVGGMGAGAGRKREDDEEHERKYMLSDDEAFLAADDGQRLVDPQTGMAASPAVIGEAPKKRV
ncbi:hypothetical protein L3Q65_24535 [Amycolatopsis sp. FU40]|uniref:hypothetical protein n=1 Tax=Amycolatopsis sp. FU40 TaxID=2914159 RepID=UPI001F1A365C|nr:hypothetical protein [Amycolatopsis sp. FU40]UKD51099.1 hypothetical protein L3Q65_24535 [Amycolatopsis sp. FU40]